MRDEITDLVVHKKLEKLIANEKEKERQRYLHSMKFFMSQLIPAGIEDYKDWLKGFLLQGGQPTHYYDYPFNQLKNEFYVATEDFAMPALYGADSLHIIVPRGVCCRVGNLGHSALYFEDGYRHQGRFVPIYNNISFHGKLIEKLTIAK